MNYRQAMKELKSAGTAQNRKVYARHGVPEPIFGVSVANLNKISKEILRLPGPGRKYAKHDHELAIKLWKSGNHDARVLGAMLADPEQMQSAELDQWMRDCDSHSSEGMLVGLTARTRFAQPKMKKWRKSDQELTAAAGWNLLCEIAQNDRDLPDSFFVSYLQEMREKIHGAKNRARYAMNGALIAIGGRSPNLRRKAIAAARKIGPVEVDHGETNCKTPDAVPYIEKMWARKSQSRPALTRSVSTSAKP